MVRMVRIQPMHRRFVSTVPSSLCSEQGEVRGKRDRRDQQIALSDRPAEDEIIVSGHLPRDPWIAVSGRDPGRLA